MAYLNATTTTGNTFTAGAASFFDRMVAKYKTHRIFRETFGELDALTDRELSDLGLHRSQIRAIALDAARDANV